MDLYILDKSFKQVGLLDFYESLIWTDRYREPGDFEVIVPFNDISLKYLIRDNYIWRADSEYTMIIETLEIMSDAENGNRLKVSGRSLESILDRRIIWEQTNLNGKLETCIEKLLNDCVINPTNAYRRIPNFVFKPSNNPYISEISIDMQFTGDYLLDAITDICEEHEIGFKVVLSDDNMFVFSLYMGLDRSYNQVSNPYVIFSPEFQNLANSSYIESAVEYKNVGLVAGEGEGADRKILIVGDDKIVGLDRREAFIDAREISSTDDNGNAIPADQYNKELETKGKVELLKLKMIEAFEGEIEVLRMFKYKESFNIGDIVEIANEYGIKGVVRITEYIFSENESGTENYPTFESVDLDAYYAERFVSLIPILTGAKDFSKGIVTSSPAYSAGYLAWYAFDGDDTNTLYHSPQGGVAPGDSIWIRYDWLDKVNPRRIIFRSDNRSNGVYGTAWGKIEVFGKNSVNEQWIKLGEADNTELVNPWNSQIELEVHEIDSIRIVATNTQSVAKNIGFSDIKVIGLHGSSQSVTSLIPIMTSNNSPSGFASTNAQYSDAYDAWHAFDNNPTGTHWAGYPSPRDITFLPFITYYWGGKTVNISAVILSNEQTNNAIYTLEYIEVQVFSDGKWLPIKKALNPERINDWFTLIKFNMVSTKAIRLILKGSHETNPCSLAYNIKVYGKETKDGNPVHRIIPYFGVGGEVPFGNFSVTKENATYKAWRAFTDDLDSWYWQIDFTANEPHTATVTYELQEGLLAIPKYVQMRTTCSNTAYPVKKVEVFARSLENKNAWIKVGEETNTGKVQYYRPGIVCKGVDKTDAIKIIISGDVSASTMYVYDISVYGNYYLKDGIVELIELIPRLTSNNGANGVASAGSYYAAAHQPFYAFDGGLGQSYSTGWFSSSALLPPGGSEWIRYDWNTPCTPKRIEMKTDTRSSASQVELVDKIEVYILTGVNENNEEEFDLVGIAINTYKVVHWTPAININQYDKRTTAIKIVSYNGNTSNYYVGFCDIRVFGY